MATILSFLSGRQITDDDGEPVSGALLYHYQAGTTNNLTVYSNQAGSIAHAQPVVCDAGGFVPLIYIGDTSDWKVVIQTPAAVTLHTYDNLPAAVASVSADDFAPPLFEWTQVTSASSPVALTAADAGKAYEANTSGGSVEFDLPSAASVGNGKGFVFKKTGAANTLTIDPNASETIDDVSTSLAIAGNHTVVGIFSNGAEWYKIMGVTSFDTLTSSVINGATSATNNQIADNDEFLFQLASAGEFRKIARKYLPGTTVAILADVKAANTSGGTFTSGADRTRTLNTAVYNRDSIVTLASDQFTLPAGEWLIEWSAPGYGVDAHQSQLYSVTGAATVQRGTTEFAFSDNFVMTRSFGAARVSQAVSTQYEIRHRCADSLATGFGNPANLGGSEVYTIVTIKAA